MSRITGFRWHISERDYLSLRAEADSEIHNGISAFGPIEGISEGS